MSLINKIQRSIAKRYIKHNFSININNFVDFPTANSYSQFGEDLILNYFIQIMLKNKIIDNVNYLEIGGFDPKVINNTYLFYNMGYSGVIVEANKDLADDIKKVRNRDIVLNYGMHFMNNNIKELPFYQFEKKYSGLSSFSKEDADKAKIENNISTDYKVVNTKLITFNEVIKKYMNDTAPIIISLDVEGIEFEILKSIDFSKYKPYFFIIEMTEYSDKILSTKKLDVLEFMNKNNYVVVADTFVNSIFLRKDIFEYMINNKSKKYDS